MAGFLYYLPGDRVPTVEYLRSLGFPHAAIASLPGGGCDKGPDGKGGKLFTLKAPPAPGGEQPAIPYDANCQTWKECAGGKWWLGWVTATPPTPCDLQTELTVTGLGVELADGNDWIIPVIRQLDGRPATECRVGVNPDGTIALDRPAPQYELLWGLVARLFKQAMKSIEQFQDVISDQECYDLLCEAMSFTYRVSKWELGHLGVLTTKNQIKVFAVICGMDPDEA